MKHTGLLIGIAVIVVAIAAGAIVFRKKPQTQQSYEAPSLVKSENASKPIPPTVVNCPDSSTLPK